MRSWARYSYQTWESLAELPQGRDAAYPAGVLKGQKWVGERIYTHEEACVDPANSNKETFREYHCTK